MSNPSFRPKYHYTIPVLLLCLIMGGCASRPRNCVWTTLLKPEMVVDLNAPPETSPSATADREVFQELTAPLRTNFADAAGQADVLGQRQLNILTLSGGGSHGAFTAGVLNGWTATGQRPVFDIVTGVSTGALIAPMVFLGSAYDNRIRELYTNVSADDIYRKRSKLALLWSDSAASSEPLERLIAANIDQNMLVAVAEAHQQGRRLYIGTTNLDTGRLVIWDMGAIAASGRPGSLALFRKIILASASVPGFFPPVSIEICVNGRRHTELHADGGTTSQVFLRGSMLNLDPAVLHTGRKPLAGSHVYVIVAGKIFPDAKCVEPRIPSIAAGALGALTSAQGRNDIVRIYTLSLLTGMEFRMAAIPQDFPAGESPMDFDPAVMRSLYNKGYQMALCGEAWNESPPVIDPSEQSIPRRGVQFLDFSENACRQEYRTVIHP